MAELQRKPTAAEQVVAKFSQGSAQEKAMLQAARPLAAAGAQSKGEVNPASIVKPTATPKQSTSGDGAATMSKAENIVGKYTQQVTSQSQAPKPTQGPKR